MTLSTLFMILAFILFIAAGIGWPPARVSLGWLGAACLTLSFLLPGVTLS